MIIKYNKELNYINGLYDRKIELKSSKKFMKKVLLLRGIIDDVNKFAHILTLRNKV
jgi:hypothetical protein